MDADQLTPELAQDAPRHSMQHLVLPCPFCGKTPKFIYQPSATNHDWTFQTGCHNAECPVDCLIETYGQQEDWEPVMEQHLARWNTRQNSQADRPQGSV